MAGVCVIPGIGPQPLGGSAAVTGCARKDLTDAEWALSSNLSLRPLAVDERCYAFECPLSMSLLTVAHGRLHGKP